MAASSDMTSSFMDRIHFPNEMDLSVKSQYRMGMDSRTFSVLPRSAASFGAGLSGWLSTSCDGPSVRWHPVRHKSVTDRIINKKRFIVVLSSQWVPEADASGTQYSLDQIDGIVDICRLVSETDIAAVVGVSCIAVRHSIVERNHRDMSTGRLCVIIKAAAGRREIVLLFNSFFPLHGITVSLLTVLIQVSLHRILLFKSIST